MFNAYITLEIYCEINRQKVAPQVIIPSMVEYDDMKRMVSFINPPSTIGIIVNSYPLYSSSVPVVPLVRYAWLRIVKVIQLPSVNQGSWQLG
jgi:hypothetical protein